MPYTEKFEDALVYAARLHRDQARKGTGVPYVTHLLAVAAIVGEGGGTEEEVISGLLHDAPEDAGGEERLAEIRGCFGDAYIDHLAGAPPSVRLVSAADKLHNARSVLADYRAVGEDLWGRFNGGRDGTLWYYRAVADALAGDGPVAEELGRVVAELEALASNPTLHSRQNLAAES